MAMCAQASRRRPWPGRRSAGAARSTARPTSLRAPCCATITWTRPCAATSPRSRPETMSQLTFLSEEHPANRSASRASVADWMTRAATWPSSSFAWLADFGPVGWFSRTCPDSCRTTMGGILEPSSGQWRNAGMGGPTASLTLNLPECHSGAVASSLSDILETGDLPQRYFLSAKACRGILRRAEKRGKTLPAPLMQALAAATRTTPETGG